MPSRLLQAEYVRALRLVAVSALLLLHLALSANDRTSVACRHRVQSRWLAGSPQRPLGLLRHPRTWPSPPLLSRWLPSSALPPSLAWAAGPSAEVSAGRAVFLTDKSSLSSSSTASIELKPSLASRSMVFAVFLCAVAHSRSSPSATTSVSVIFGKSYWARERTTPSSCPSERSQHRLPQPHKDSKVECTWPCSRA